MTQGLLSKGGPISVGTMSDPRTSTGSPAAYLAAGRLLVALGILYIAVSGLSANTGTTSDKRSTGH